MTTGSLLIRLLALASLSLAGVALAGPPRPHAPATAEPSNDAPLELAQGGDVLPVDRLESPPVGAQGATLRPIDVGHAELCRPGDAGEECRERDLYDETFRINATALPGGSGDTRLSFHGHPGFPRGFLILGRDGNDRIRLAAEYWPAEGSANLRDGRLDSASGGRPPILWVTFSSACAGGEACGYTHWAPLTFDYQEGRHRLVPAGPVTTNAVHSSRESGGVLACVQAQGGPAPVTNANGSYTVADLVLETRELVEHTLTWSRESQQLVVSQSSAPRPAPITGDCPPE
jgi:hypothetical protein